MSTPRTSEGQFVQNQLEYLLTNTPYFDRQLERRLVGHAGDISSADVFLRSLHTNGVFGPESLSSLKEKYPVTIDRVIYAIETVKRRRATAALVLALEESDNSHIISELYAWCVKTLGAPSRPASEPTTRTAATATANPPLIVVSDSGSEAGQESKNNTTESVAHLIRKKIELIGGDEPFDEFLRPSRVALCRKTAVRLDSFMRELKAVNVLKEADIQKITRENSSDEDRADKVYSIIVTLDHVEGMVTALEKSKNGHVVEILRKIATE